ncbi:HEAT repeat domain-containing protein [Jiulongibacter sp. NS-SX5]|uniref:HEAT repeat domain-containing protein n=1 Tax=Jiulongibacter sp. NS-SX5 TaxID=3463854 RepID=UPI004059D2AB
MAVKKEDLRQACQPLITEVLFEESLSKESQQTEKLLLESSFGSKVLVEELLKLKSTLQGESAEVLDEYYAEKKLYKEAYKKLSSLQSSSVISALFELTKMNYQGACRTIINLKRRTNNTEILENSALALIKLDYKLAFDELLKSEFYLSDWFQVQALQALKIQNVNIFPPLASWLIKADSYQIFGCRLKAFSKSETETKELATLLTHSNESVRKEAIKTFGKIYHVGIYPRLIQIYADEPVANKCEIIKVITSFHMVDSLDFMIKCARENSQEIRQLAKNAVRSICESIKEKQSETPVFDLLPNSVKLKAI